VPRQRLIRRLEGIAEVPVVIVSAGAGYGKTIALAQWAADDDRPFAWLALEGLDGDPVRLLRYLAVALEDTEPLDEDVGAELGRVHPDLADVAVPLLARSIASRKPFVLVLDDTQALSSSEAWAHVTTLAGALPPRSQIVLSGRGLPALRRGRLRAAGALAEICAADLAMTAPETESLFAESGVHLPPDDVDSRLVLTEGWPAALALQALFLGPRNHRLAVAGGREAAARDAISCYLEEEVLVGLSEDGLGLLLRTSVLEQLCGPLCDAVLGVSGSGRRLEQLARSQDPFVLSLGNGWYRVQHLLRELLVDKLRAMEPDQEQVAHERARTWLDDHPHDAPPLAKAQPTGEHGHAGGPLLTIAERRVLSLLPSHRSLQEIADELYLSRNTIKTHAISIYRKLGVAARSPAVDRARALGLLASVAAGNGAAPAEHVVPAPPAAR
jgi:LuxR family maltose regulon positive regulatory protein